MAVRALLVLVVLALLYGCEASSPVEKQEKQGGVEQAKPKEPTEQAGASAQQSTARARAFTGTYKCEDFSSREAAQEYLDTTRLSDAERKVIDPDDNGRACDERAYRFTSSIDATATPFPVPTEEEVVQAGANCRLRTYANKENMSQQEANNLSERVADEKVEEMQDDPSLNAGSAQNKVLDDLAVPRYSNCETGLE